MQTPDFAALQTLLAVVETGSFSRAAERLETTPGAVSRRIAALEQRLGVRLLNRTTRRLGLTEAGELYVEDVDRVLRALAEAEDRVTHLSEAPRGSLRVAAPLSFGLHTLSPLLPGFAARYPGLRVSIDLDDRIVDLLANGADLALRIGPLADSSLVARRLGSYRRVVCAAPAYLARRGEPATPADLVGHDCLHYSNIALKEEWAFGASPDAAGSGRAGPATVEVSGPLCANNGDLLREAAVAGLGICSLPEFIVAEDLAAGRLKAVLADYEPPDLTLWALWPSRRYVPAKVRVFVDYVAERLSREGDSESPGSARMRVPRQSLMPKSCGPAPG